MKLFDKIEHCYNPDGEPIRCTYCGGTNFQGEITEIVAGNIAEEHTRCTDCGKFVAFWAYGSYEPMPHLIYHPVKIVKDVVNWFIIKGFTK